MLSNHLAGTKFEPGKLSFRALSPFVSPVAEPLKGLTFSFDNGNIFLAHPGAKVNQNLAMDGHAGSVIAFGGVPLFGFSPANIDQSDANSVMPIPAAGKRADRPSESSSETGKGSSKSNSTTVGEGKSGSGC